MLLSIGLQYNAIPSHILMSRSWKALCVVHKIYYYYLHKHERGMIVMHACIMKTAFWIIIFIQLAQQKSLPLASFTCTRKLLLWWNSSRLRLSVKGINLSMEIQSDLKKRVFAGFWKNLVTHSVIWCSIYKSSFSEMTFDAQAYIYEWRPGFDIRSQQRGSKSEKRINNLWCYET